MKLFRVLGQEGKVVATFTADTIELEKGKNVFALFGPGKEIIGTLYLGRDMSMQLVGPIGTGGTK